MNERLAPISIEDAEEYTQSLGQIFSGSWRQIALANRLGVPQALGLSLEDWVTTRLGGYVKMSIVDRRQAVKELTDDGYSTRDIGEVLGVDHATAARDVANATGASKKPKEKKTKKTDTVANATDAPIPSDRFGRTPEQAENDAKLSTGMLKNIVSTLHPRGAPPEQWAWQMFIDVDARFWPADAPGPLTGETLLACAKVLEALAETWRR
jgi:hypothetical protein